MQSDRQTSQDFLIGNNGIKYAYVIVQLSIDLNRFLDIILSKPIIFVHNNHTYHYQLEIQHG